jgi:hypothetical protein
MSKPRSATVNSHGSLSSVFLWQSVGLPTRTILGVHNDWSARRIPAFVLIDAVGRCGDETGYFGAYLVNRSVSNVKSLRFGKE